MSPFRLFGLVATLGGVILLAEATAQNPPGVKVQPQIKPGDGKNPIPMPKPGDKGVNPGVPGGGVPGVPPGGGIPGAPGTVPGLPGIPGTPAGPAAPPPKAKGNNQFPKEIGGKKLDFYVKELKTNPDPANREQCARVIPLFGPEAASVAASENMIFALSKDTDTNVRVAALQSIPQMGLSDTFAEPGMAAIAACLNNTQVMIQFEAVLCLGNIGPYAGKLSPKVVTVATGSSNSWQLRKAACMTLGSIGLPVPMYKIEQDPDAVRGLLRVLREDRCAQVKREAVTSLIKLGPTTVKEWKPQLEALAKSEIEKDLTTKLLARVCLVKNDTVTKGADVHIASIANILLKPDPNDRAAALQALGLIGDAASATIKEIISILNDPVENPVVVMAAILAVTNMPSQSALTIPVLQKVEQSSPHEDIKKAAGEAAKVLKNPLEPMPKKG